MHPRPAPAALPDGPQAPDLASYDKIVVSISAGKDSQAALHRTILAATAAGVTDRVMTVFADLGPEHARFYGVPHEVVYREITGPDGQKVQQTLTQHIEQRGKWPDASRRYCTSDMKRAPIQRLYTRIAADHRAEHPGRKVRILAVLGMRAQESRTRALLQPFAHDSRASNRTVRHVDQWLPVHQLTTSQIWDLIAEAGTRPHWVYAYLPRLSCRFCVLAGKAALIRSALLDPAGAARRADLEQRMGHQFRQNLSMADIIQAARGLTLDTAPPAVTWAA